jgi:hypothetical protein
VGQSNLLTLVVFLLVFACILSAIMVLRGDADTRRLESRIKSLHEVAVGPSGGGARQAPRNIRRATGGSPLARALERFGRARHIPKERRLPWPIIAVAGVGGAAAASYIGAKILGAALAPSWAWRRRCFSPASCSAGRRAATRGSSSRSFPTPWA